MEIAITAIAAGAIIGIWNLTARARVAIAAQERAIARLEARIEDLETWTRPLHKGRLPQDP